VEEAGGEAEIFMVPETLSEEVLIKMHAPPKGDYQLASNETLESFDYFLFGIPTRYGNRPAQLSTFWDATGQLWGKGALYGKYAGVFVSTASMGGGVEATPYTFMSTLTHHGFIFVPLGYARAFEQLTSLEEPHSGSAWGAGTLVAADGSRQPSELELKISQIQGKEFYKTIEKVRV